MAEVEFSLRYDGPAVAQNRIPVREFAPAVLALGELFSEANQIAFPGTREVRLEISATDRGSFSVRLILLHIAERIAEMSDPDSVTDLLAGEESTALVNLMQYVIGVRGAFWVLQQIRNRNVSTEEPSPDDPTMTRLELQDGTVIETPTPTRDMIRSVRIRRSARAVIAPLETEGIDVLDLQPETDTTVTIGTADIPAFDLPEDAEEREWLSDQTFEVHLTVISPVLAEEERAWRLDDGTQRFNATMAASAFAERAASGAEDFRAGDILRCRMRQRQYRDQARRLQAERTVLEVLEHIRATSTEQRELPLPEVTDVNLPEPAPDTEDDQQ